jgi:hypothetical protein
LAGQHSPAGARNLGVGGGGTGGTLGGRMTAGAPSTVPQGDAAYLWALVVLEVLAISWLRQAFKRHHGG